jgi:pimeloyl-ACP methyl ester carboxylesterase
MNGRFVSAPGAELHAEWSSPAAQGTPLAFLHAGVADGRMWHPQWQALAATHPLLRYDRRGFGRTRVLQAQAYSRSSDCVAVLDAAAWPQAALVGCSQGGRVALDLALAHPQRVRALVLVAPAVGGAPVPDDAAMTAPVLAQSAAIEAAEQAGDVDTVNRLEARLWLDGPTAPEGRVGGDARALFMDMNGIALRAADPGSAIEPEPAAWDRLQEVRAPTLVLWGDLDLPHLQARCEALVQRIPGARRVVLPGTAHLPNLEAPARFNAALAAFLATLPAWP